MKRLRQYTTINIISKIHQNEDADAFMYEYECVFIYRQNTRKETLIKKVTLLFAQLYLP